MKIKFDIEIDTNDDKEVGEELLNLLRLMADRLDALNEQDEN